MFKEKINEDIKNALKSGDSAKAGTLRMVLASFNNKEIEKRGKGGDSVLTEDEELDILMKEVKKRKESADVYKQGGREDLAQKELAEIEIIQIYLPEQLSQGEVEKMVDEAIKKTGASTIKDMGKVMGEVMKEAKGKADSKAISEIIKEKLKI